jgi:hypothetical protein
MSQIHRLERTDGFDRDLFFIAQSDFASMPELESFSGSHFVVFLAADAAGVEIALLSEFVRKLLSAGCVYFCVWGSGCERLHDIIDEESFTPDQVIMTSWHSDESLDEALSFFIRHSRPDDAYLGSTKNALAISIGNIDWATQISRRLTNLDSLNRNTSGEC